MANYVFLYAGDMEPADSSEEARNAVMAAWMAWFGQMGPAVVDGGNPFSPESRTVASDGSVKKGPVGVPATGYSVVKADSLDAAVEMAKGCPGLKSGGQVSVYETFNVM